MPIPQQVRKWHMVHCRACPGCSPQVPPGSPKNQIQEHPSSRESRVNTLIFNPHSFLPCKYIQTCQKRGQSLSSLQVPQDECNVLQDCSSRWWMQYYQLGSLGKAHKMQERKVMLGARGLASMTLFLEVLHIYHHHRISKGTNSSKCFLKNTV